MLNQRLWGLCLFLITIACAISVGVLAANDSGGDNVSGSTAVQPTTGVAGIGAAVQGDNFFEDSLKDSKIQVHFKRLGRTGTEPSSGTTTSGNASGSASSGSAAGSASTMAAPSATATGSQSGNATTSNASAGQSAAAAVSLAAATQAIATSQAALAQSNMTGVVTPENLTVGENVTHSGNASAASPSQTAGISSGNNTTNVSAPNATGAIVTEENATNITGAPVEEEEVAKSEENETEEEYGTDRIWREGMPAKYTWTPQTFSGFFYDLDDKVGTEKLTIQLGESGSGYSRAIDSGNIVYKSDVSPLEFQFGQWGEYDVVGFMAEKYFAGYIKGELFDKDMSLINENQLRRVLIDSDDEETITSGSVLPLEEGYELRINEIDLNGNKVYLALAKDGEEIDSKVITPSDIKSATYKYEVDVSGDDVPLVMAHVSNVFAGAESSLVTVDGLFQISDTYASVEEDDKYGEMQVTMVSDTGIEMNNEDSLTLRKGKTVKLMGDVGLQVADSETLRFAPTVERTGNYEIRGTIVDPAQVDHFTWTPYNFEGFYYDIDDDVGTEKLEVTISGEKIPEDNLKYESSPQPVRFEFETWGNYSVIGFMADKYFAGYSTDTAFTDEFSAINEGQLRKVLTDSDDEETISSGAVLPLEEGYELQIKEVDMDGNKVWLAVNKDGEEVDSKVVNPESGNLKSSTYVYKVEIGTEDVPIIAAHISSVFRGAEADLATIDGLFQVSDEPESVEEGETHGKMEVDSLSDAGISMKNDGSISLGRGKDVEIMGNLKLRVADNADRNFCPIALRTGKVEPLRINLTQARVNVTTDIEVTSGTSAVSGAKVLIDGEEIGTTDAGGLIRYLPERSGTFNVQAKLTGYTDANSTLVVRSDAEARRMAITVPSEVTKGESFLITVKGGLDASPIEGVTVTFDGQEIGTTGSQGDLSYSSNDTGEFTITAEKDGYDRATRTISVISALKVINLSVTGEATAGKSLMVTAEIENSGKVIDSKELELKVNGNSTDKKEATIGPGETKNISFEYRPKDAGLYSFEVDGLQQAVSVEEAKSNWMIWAALLIILVAIGAGAYLYKTGELEAMRKRIQGR